MLSLVSLLAAAALVSQCQPTNSHFIDNSKLEMENSLPAVTPHRRQMKKYVHIVSSPGPAVGAAAGQAVELECQAIGSPAPRITWLRNGEPLPDMEEESNQILPAHPASVAQLRSRLVVVARHREVYTCIATAGRMQTSATTVVFVVGDKVVDPLEAIESPPVITAWYEDVIQPMGADLILPCRAHAQTDAQTQWTDNTENKNKPIYDNTRFMVLPSGDLVIRSLTWDDMGRYTCTVTDRYGVATADTFVYPMRQ